MKRTTLAINVAALAAIAAGGLAFARQGHPEKPQDGSPDMGAMLVEGLRRTEGCLGVDAGQFMSGKNAILAWFEDKEAAARWYYSETHQRMMQMALGHGAKEQGHTPLEHVEDGIPIMVVASITFTDRPEVEGIAMPISQMAIEIYSAQPGGGHINGRLAPPTFPVAHLKEYWSPPPAE